MMRQFVMRAAGRMLGWRCSLNILRTLTPVLVRNRLAIGAGGGTTLAFSLFGATPKDTKKCCPEIPNFDTVIREADTLYDTYLIDNAYNILRKYEKSTCSELLWRLARVLCEKGKLSNDQTKKKEYILKAYEVVVRAVELEPPEGCFGAHKWIAILLDYVGEIEGTKARIAKSYEVRKHLERAIQINPSDATTWHILGVWHFTFADMSSMTRLAASAIFGTPPSSTYKQSLEHFLKAEQIQANFYSTNTFYIGEVYSRLGDSQRALKFFRRAFSMPVITADDQQTHAKAHERLKKLKVSDSELISTPQLVK